LRRRLRRSPFGSEPGARQLARESIDNTGKGASRPWSRSRCACCWHTQAGRPVGAHQFPCVTLLRHQGLERHPGLPENNRAQAIRTAAFPHRILNGQFAVWALGAGRPASRRLAGSACRGGAERGAVRAAPTSSLAGTVRTNRWPWAIPGSSMDAAKTAALRSQPTCRRLIRRRPAVWLPRLTR
jgi:hypothetical protein